MQNARAWIYTAFLVLGLFGVAPSAHAQQTFSLVWAVNPEPDVVSYRVHVGTTSQQYTRVFTTTRNSLNISSLPIGPVYYFAVTAMNSAGLESDFSPEISSAGSPSGPLVTTALTASSIRLTVQTAPSAVVTFDSSTNLVHWQVFTSLTANASGLAILNQGRSTSGANRFFRVRLP